MKIIRTIALSILAMVGLVISSQAQIQTQGNLLVDLNATNASLGKAALNVNTNAVYTLPPLSNTPPSDSRIIAVTNNGTLGGVFFAEGAGTNELPQIGPVNGGTLGMIFNSRKYLAHYASVPFLNSDTNGNGSTNVGVAVSAPAQITGIDPPVSIEVWGYNPTIGPREDMVSWGITGGTNSLMAFGWGHATVLNGGAVDRNGTGNSASNRLFLNISSAVGTDSKYASPNLAWGTALPPAGGWHHLVYTFSGATKVNKLYEDGVLVLTRTNFSSVLTTPGTNITIGAARGNPGVNGGGGNSTVNATLALAKVRVMDGVLTAANVLNNYNFEKGQFTNGFTALSTLPTHRWQFNNAATNEALNTPTIVDTIGAANGTVKGVLGGFATFDGTKLHLSGGYSSGTFSPPYVDLPNGLISSLSLSNAGPGKITLEGWGTPDITATWGWMSWFSFGRFATNATFPTGETNAPNTLNIGYGGQNYLNWGIQGQGNGNVGIDSRLEITGANVNTHDINVPRYDQSTVGFQYWAMTWDEAAHSLIAYVNGVEYSQAFIANIFTNVSDVNDWLGRDNWNGDGYMQGTYTEFRIYTNILTPGEIATDYKYGPSGIWTNLADVGVLNSITLDPLKFTTLIPTASQALHVTAAYAGTGGYVTEISGDPGTTYGSDNTAAATVTSNGMLTLVAPGVANITAAFGGKTSSISVTVSNSATPTLAHRFSFSESPGSGTTADSIGTAVGTFTTGFTDGAGHGLLGSGAFVTFPTNMISGLEQMTVEGWFDFQTVAGNSCAWSLGNNLTGGVNGGVAVGSRGIMTAANGGRTFLFSDTDFGAGHEQSAAVVLGGNFSANTNMHLVGVYDPIIGHVKFYTNGVLAADVPGRELLSNIVDNLNYIGKSLYNDPLLNCSVDEWRIWNGALSTKQIAVSSASGPNNTNFIFAGPGAFVNQTFSIPLPNTIKLATQFAAFTANFASVTNVNLFAYDLPNVTTFSDNPTVASIDPRGFINANNAGTTVLHAVYFNGATSITNNATIVVVDPNPVMIHRYTFNADVLPTAKDSIGTADGTYTGASQSNALGKAVLTAADGDFINLPGNVIAGQLAISIEAWVSYGSNVSGAWLFGIGQTDGSSFGGNYIYYTPHIGANNRGGITGIDPGVGNEQNMTQNNIIYDNRTNVHVALIWHPFAGFQKLIINGGTITSNNATFLLSQVQSNLAYIGRSLYENATNPYPAQSYLNASIDEFRIYSGVLDTNQVALNDALGPNITNLTSPGTFVSAKTIINSNMSYLQIQQAQVLGTFTLATNVNLYFFNPTGTNFPALSSTDTNVFIATSSNGNIQATGSGVANLLTVISGVTNTNTITVRGGLRLAHRYSFTANANDSVGTANGTLRNAGGPENTNVTIVGGLVDMTGGGGGDTNAGYVELPGGIISSLTNSGATFEAWALDRAGAAATWSRIFDFGNNSSGIQGNFGNGVNYAFLCPVASDGKSRFAWERAGNGGTNEIPRTDGLAMTTNVMHHYIVSAQDELSPTNAGQAFLMLDGVVVSSNDTVIINTGGGATFPAGAFASSVPNKYSTMLDINNWLGRSQWNDPFLNGQIDEFRIWDGALSRTEASNSFARGPDATVLNLGPTPTVALVGTNAVVTWPAAGNGGYGLDVSSNLTVWVHVTNSPVTAAGIRTVTVPALPAPKYFRLSSGL